MKNQNPNGRADVTTLPILPGTILITVGVLVSFLLLMTILYSAHILTPPAFLEGIFSQDAEDTPDDGFSDQFLASLTGHSPLTDSANEKLLDLSPDALRDMLLGITTVDSYYHSATVTWSDANNRFTAAQVSCLVSGDRFHGESHVTGISSKQLTADADTLYIREGSSSRRFPRGEEYAFTPESELGLPSLARMQKMIAEAEAGKYTLTMETMLDSPCIRAIFTDTASGVREIFDVLPDYGIIVTASSYLPGEQSPYYMVQTNSILTDISEFDEAIFEIPTS